MEKTKDDDYFKQMAKDVQELTKKQLVLKENMMTISYVDQSITTQAGISVEAGRLFSTNK